MTKTMARKRLSKADATARLLEALGVTEEEWARREARRCQCWHGLQELDGWSGHEFARYGERGRTCCGETVAWQGIWTCDQQHQHLIQVCGDCKTCHDADVAIGGVQVVWDEITASRITSP